MNFETDEPADDIVEHVYDNSDFASHIYDSVVDDAEIEETPEQVVVELYLFLQSFHSAGAE